MIDRLERDPEAPKWGAWGVRHLRARKSYDCFECGHMILRGATYWRRFGKMAEAVTPFTARMCERCEARWRGR